VEEAGPRLGCSLPWFFLLFWLLLFWLLNRCLGLKKNPKFRKRTFSKESAMDNI
jgi:hypothetical protein